MSSQPDRPAPSAESMIGTTFVLFMQLRIVMFGAVVVFGGMHGEGGLLVLLAVTAALTAAALVAHRRVVSLLLARPALLGFDALLGYAVLLSEGEPGAHFMITVVSSGIVGLLCRWPAAALVCAQQVVLYQVAMYHAGLWAPGHGAFTRLVVLPAFYPLGVLVGAVLRRLYEEHAAGAEARWRLASMALAADERARLAREMHDSLTGALSGIALSATALPAWVRKSPDRAEAEARRIATAATVAARVSRTLISDLRDETLSLPLAAALRSVAEEWTARTGTPARVVAGTDAEPPMLARYETVAIVKQALENIARHARATGVEVLLERGRSGLAVRVRDDGCGFAAPRRGPGWLDELADAGHYGLLGMHERARRAGGELVVTSGPESGTEIAVLLPETAAEEGRK